MKDKFQQITQKSYDQIAGQFSYSRNYVWSDLQVFLEYVNDGDDVLDLGAGNGRMVEFLQDKAVNYLGVDSSRELIKQAKQKFPKFKFQVKDALKINYRNKFDVVIATAVLNHFADEKSRIVVLKNIYRSLKPGGDLLMSNWNMWNEKNPKGMRKFEKMKKELNDENFFDKFGVKKSEIDTGDVLTVWGEDSVLYYHAFTIEELKELCEKVGFKVVKNYYSLRGVKSTKLKGDNLILVGKKWEK
ncbi:hypothetical protein A2533_01745 [Candidatus Falkowbacteria bacterium RIFOXYD2_FULL_35_9]|uniref:Uncharacterized protein n=1 Tax=Candidatus Falkowbacteria bacterium RIFOXYC2_FULL_36_12 TaxID=1798002 RepID=A0A1F5SZY8_9BACT|nr:MAG: hypothetical protein A2300_00910 [Candidatus Falkowbacteria bacterium RIFOXYB2_FULL_35_7]OGF32274.1 MAG: hypothetical protein A2478_03030 [Candidatus Falkowbacteria bacterium RIFOXYC2_FULL_36_12]OGF33853.1 MAG: hypothetical protein A2223_01245 [Candidatus Falkowbacteria bacterium RIFOXYA2_FULL_35_8]OGF47961.1 MAG: hypothetical protein A2533_01745 [Candidatus Falkowbacteria bacterium RIFOXYD2_FULL_35_9]